MCKCRWTAANPTQAEAEIARRTSPLPPDDRRIPGMSADAAPLLVPRQIIAVSRRLDGRNGGNQLLSELGRQEIRQI